MDDSISSFFYGLFGFTEDLKNNEVKTCTIHGEEYPCTTVKIISETK